MFTSNTKLSLYLETISKTWVVIWAKMSSVTWISSIAHWECGLGEARKRYRTRVKFPTLFLLGRWLRASHSHLLNRVIIPISQSCQGWKEIKSTFKSHSAIQVWIISVNFIVYLSWIWIDPKVSALRTYLLVRLAVHVEGGGDRAGTGGRC